MGDEMSGTRLNAERLRTIAAGQAPFSYDRDAQKTGIVHFGIGAFHRAHEAWYTHRAMMAGDRDWMIIGVSMRSPTIRDQLNPQDGLYTLTTSSAQGRATEIIASVRQVLVASQDAPAIVATIADADVHVISFTVTEKGYCRAPDGGIDQAAADDGSIYPLLLKGLRKRMVEGLPGVTLLSCDNLANNGRQLKTLLLAYARDLDTDVGAWIEAECRFPCSMVDRIVPAPSSGDRDLASAAIGADDRGAIVTEPFSQWVIEDDFAGSRPAWDLVGASIVTDVAPYETAKLRMLNGAHSALAYLGLLRGHSFVREAVMDPIVRPIVTALMRDEALPTIKPAPEQDLFAYADQLLDRFANPTVDHKLIQIAMDGSQKVPQRWLETLAERQCAGQQSPAILAAIAAWRRHLRGDNIDRWGQIEDPMADILSPFARRDDEGFAHAILGPDGIFAPHCVANALTMENLVQALGNGMADHSAADDA